jgi:hypothetical protein
MAQIFSPSADTALRAFFLILAACAAGSVLLAAGWMDSTYATLVGWVPGQPVPFSHQHHVAGLGIDCRYCHTTVESSPHAGLPATEVCMTCHSQIWTDAPVLAPIRESLASGKPLAWQRVAKLPDYVFFNHRIHVARGVPCVSCHGRIDTMPLTYRAVAFQMRWCLSCHRDPAPRLRPPDMVTRMDWSKWDEDGAHADYGRLAMKALSIDPSKLDDCALCHR